MYTLPLTVVSYVVLSVLMWYSLYFLGIEFMQMMNEGTSYLSSLWNYFDFIPFMFMIIFAILDLLGLFDTYEFKWLEGCL
jgi:hypothetical protein